MGNPIHVYNLIHRIYKLLPLISTILQVGYMHFESFKTVHIMLFSFTRWAFSWRASTVTSDLMNRTWMESPRPWRDYSLSTGFMLGKIRILKYLSVDSTLLTWQMVSLLGGRLLLDSHLSRFVNESLLSSWLNGSSKETIFNFTLLNKNLKI